MKVQINKFLTFVSVPHRQNSEDEGTEGGSEETSPVVPHREEGGCDFDAEQHTCRTVVHMGV